MQQIECIIWFLSAAMIVSSFKRGCFNSVFLVVQKCIIPADPVLQSNRRGTLSFSAAYCGTDMIHVKQTQFKHAIKLWNYLSTLLTIVKYLMTKDLLLLE